MSAELTPEILQKVINSKEMGRVLNDLSTLAFSRGRQSLFPSLRRWEIINKECGYPEWGPNVMEYKMAYEQEGIATRCVSVYPDECWTVDPEILENDQPKDSPWEQAYRDLEERIELNHYLHRIDEMSGIGRFGILLIGLNDGQPLDRPVDVLDNNGNRKPNASKQYDVTYLRAFDEYAVTITQWEGDPSSPRYSKPVYYQLKFVNNTGIQAGNIGVVGEFDYFTLVKVHWTRVIHVADDCKASEVYGTPRLQNVFNRILDLRKLLGASAEMFYKGGFPGISFETPPGTPSVNIDIASLQKQVFAYMEGLQRFLALENMTAKSLTPQAVSPQHHIAAQLQAVAMALRIPLRILLGSEEARLASNQDTRTWNKRVAKRQIKYLNPRLVGPVNQRLMAYGSIEYRKRIITRWPDLNSPTAEDHADLSVKMTNAVMSYIQGGGPKAVGLREWLVMFMNFTPGQAEVIIKNLKAIPIDLSDVGSQAKPQSAGVMKNNTGEDKM